MGVAGTTTAADAFLRYVNLSSVAGVEPIAVDHGSGAELWDVDGRRYLDCFAGISVVSTGHSHPRVVAAAREQMERFIHCGTYLYQVPVVGTLAERLAQVTPGRLEKTFFSNSGAEAVEGAMRLARAYSGKTEFIALETGFHGRTNATLAVTGNRKRKHHGGPYLGGVAFAPAPHPTRCRVCGGGCTLRCADAVEDVINYQTSGNVAAFIAEPVLGEAGIVVPHPEYFARVKEILDRHGILFIVDEVQTGFGRTGRMFGIEHYGVEPDIMTVAKGIASGFPLGGFIARPEIAESFQPGEHLSTFGGNPVACAAAVATLDVIADESLCENSARLGEWMLGHLEQLGATHPVIGEVRGKGLMIGVELVESRESMAPAAQRAVQVRAACRERGLIVGIGGFFGNVVRIQPPLVITEAQLDSAVGVLDEALRATA
ncbi:MAG: aspartate aminotransferase family protein [Candidatus Dormibacteraeota bacterium]|uniref:alanine--glyoxylate transaminase n=1 Tax=Candidatus Aeolococcus gillhamiae TaxID=3127015 RepID=A0A2W6A4B9_9BACT|nr:aspartate aminotransferase family protein [Candidatus Dormibacteraeota bacterium]PZR80218.1 MAG: aspartate aminotransferase family protein [Candidatus Dormibacter sp. RRmetagenome_bin12]